MTKLLGFRVEGERKCLNELLSPDRYEIVDPRTSFR